MTAYGYLRKSVSRDPEREVSHEVQETAIRELASRHGDAEIHLLSDWNISGRLGADKRPGYAELLSAIESGECTALYSYSLSRLGRSVPELSRLIEMCTAKNIPVRIAVDAVDTSTASGRLLTHVLASVAAFEADVASERIRAAMEAKLARGESLRTTPQYGEREGEDAQQVLRAMEEAGSYSGAAKLLNEWGVKPRNSARGWWPSSVAVVVKRLVPELNIPGPKGAPRTASKFVLARLLRCPTCGTMLTGTRDRLDGPNKGRVRYACRMGTALPHSRISISEHLILPAIQEEVSRLAPPEAVAMDEPAVEAERAALEQRRLRILDMYEAGDIDKAERAQRLESIRSELQKLSNATKIKEIPALDWSWDPMALNGVLRALFTRIDLDPETFQPIQFEWAVPEWRA